MSNTPLILLSNDDGIQSPGLHAAAEALEHLGELVVAAPSRQQTAAGRALRHNPEAVFTAQDFPLSDGSILTGWALDASPAVAVRHGIQCLCDGRLPDLVVSGINFGENIGSNVTASGTVGAAIQAAAWGVKALAVSFEVDESYHYDHSGAQVDWSGAVGILRRVTQRVLSETWPDDVHVIKLDIPENAGPETPWRVTRQSLEPGWWGFVPKAGPTSTTGSTVGRRGPRQGRRWAYDDDMATILHRKEVSLTPLSIDMTSRTPFAEVAGFLDATLVPED